MTNGSLMKVESIAECSHLSILQCFLGIFKSDRCTQFKVYCSRYTGKHALLNEIVLVTHKNEVKGSSISPHLHKRFSIMFLSRDGDVKYSS